MPGRVQDNHAAQPAPGSCTQLDSAPSGPSSSRRREVSSIRTEAAAGATSDLGDESDDCTSTASSRGRERCLIWTEASAGAIYWH